MDFMCHRKWTARWKKARRWWRWEARANIRLRHSRAEPAGITRHAFAGNDLRRSLYSGQFGFFYVEPKSNPGNYDQEVFLAAHQWEPEFVSMQDIRKGPPPNNGLEVMWRRIYQRQGARSRRGDPRQSRSACFISL